MATKKKEVVYVPISSNIPNAQQQNLSIPQYEDRGIQYKGYSKIAMGLGEFKLKKQETRFYYFVHDDTSGTQLNIPRSNKITHNFYCTGITLSWREGILGAYKYLIIYDGNTNNARFAIWLPPGTASTQFIDMSNCPRMFSGDIISTVPGAFAVGNGVLITLTGFDEEI
jgi:hypothetical protein